MPDSSKQKHSTHDHTQRKHFEALGHQWAVLVGNPRALMPQIVGTVIHAGGTRPCWQRQEADTETILMAWPQEEPIRAAVIMHGSQEGQLKPVTAVPFLEGMQNDFTVEESRPWKSGVEGHVGVSVLQQEHEAVDNDKPLWFYNPLYFRDKEDLTAGVTHTFSLAGLAFGVRKALIDELTVTQGPAYESYAEAWLKAFPDKGRLDVPPLKINLVGKQIIMPGRNFCEYEIRCTILEVEKTQLDKLDVYILRMAFPLPKQAPLHLAVYAPSHLLKDYEPQVNDDIDAYVWLQGRIADK